MKIKTSIEVICILLIAILVCTLAVTAFASPDYNFTETTYTVEDGDCLWYIANNYCPDSMDKREYIKLIKELNDLDDSTIYPGQRLTVLESQN